MDGAIRPRDKSPVSGVPAKKDAGQHLDLGGFPGAVRADVSDQLAGRKIEGNPVNGFYLFVVVRKDILCRAEQPRFSFNTRKVLLSSDARMIGAPGEAPAISVPIYFSPTQNIR
jgi:hypothetical protein